MTIENKEMGIRFEVDNQQDFDKWYAIRKEQIRAEVISEISREMRVLYDNEYEKQIRADAIDKELYEYAFWLFTNYSGGGAVGGSVAHDNAIKSIEEFKQWQKGAEE